MRDFTKVKRIVIKIGTNTLTKDGEVNTAYVRRLARQVTELLKTGREVIIVSSGAIGMGAEQLKLAGQITKIKMRQACAAIGQPLLMDEYRKSFARYGIGVAQVLLTTEVLNNRKSYLNLRNSIETLLKLGVVPVLNENDSVSTEEIGSAFGDNDRLSALVASKIDADLLIMLSDIDALYDKDPRKFADARPITAVYEVTDDIMRSAGGKGSKYAVGGMKTKIEAAKIASTAGCSIVLANGQLKNVIARIIAGTEIGTAFYPKRKLSNRARWILNSISAGVYQMIESVFIELGIIIILAVLVSGVMRLLKQPLITSGRDRRAMVIAVGGTKSKKMFDSIRLTMKYFLPVLDMNFAANLFVNNIDSPGQIQKHPAAMNEAYRLGKELITTASPPKEPLNVELT